MVARSCVLVRNEYETGRRNRTRRRARGGGGGRIEGRYTERAKTRDALRVYVYVYVYVHVGVRMYTSMCAWDGFDARKKDEEYEGEWWI